jgi:hypothetical protein
VLAGDGVRCRGRGACLKAARRVGGKCEEPSFLTLCAKQERHEYHEEMRRRPVRAAHPVWLSLARWPADSRVRAPPTDGNSLGTLSSKGIKSPTVLVESCFRDRSQTEFARDRNAAPAQIGEFAFRRSQKLNDAVGERPGVTDRHEER